MLHAWRMRKHMDALAGMHLAHLFLGEMECSIAVSCFLFKVAEKVVLYLFFMQDVLPSWILLLQLENWLHLTLHICCIPVTIEMETLRCSTNHSLPKQKMTKVFTLEDCLLEKALNVSLDLSGRQDVTRWHHLKSDHLVYDKFDNLFNIRLFRKIQEGKVVTCLKCYVFKTSRLGEYGCLCWKNEKKKPELWQ